MRSIATGGAGPGSNLADALAQHHDVVIIDNLAKPCSPDSGLLPRGC